MSQGPRIKLLYPEVFKFTYGEKEITITPRSRITLPTFDAWMKYYPMSLWIEGVRYCKGKTWSLTDSGGAR